MRPPQKPGKASGFQVKGFRYGLYGRFPHCISFRPRHLCYAMLCYAMLCYAMGNRLSVSPFDSPGCYLLLGGLPLSPSQSPHRHGTPIVHSTASFLSPPWQVCSAKAWKDSAVLGMSLMLPSCPPQPFTPLPGPLAGRPLLPLHRRPSQPLAFSSHLQPSMA